jgi:hypothetical protein
MAPRKQPEKHPRTDFRIQLLVRSVVEIGTPAATFEEAVVAARNVGMQRVLEYNGDCVVSDASIEVVGISNGLWQKVDD